jgi:hypothetical protein
MATPKYSPARGQAETLARQLVDELREKVILAVAQGDIKGMGAQGLREQVAQLFGSFVGQNVQFDPYLREAWDLSVQNADRLLKQKFLLPDTALSPNIPLYGEIVRSGFSRVMSDAAGQVLTLLTRAQLSADMTKETVMNEIGIMAMSGLFEKVSNKTVGVVIHEIDTIAADGFAQRSRELQEQIAYKAHTNTLQSVHKGDQAKIVKGEKRPIMISVWLHSKNSMIYRPNHLDMNGKGIILGDKFTLIGKKGDIYYTIGPKDVNLPIEETANCHCRTATKLLWVTSDEESEIRDEAERSGGYVDSRWYAESEEFQMS